MANKYKQVKQKIHKDSTTDAIVDGLGGWNIFVPSFLAEKGINALRDSNVVYSTFEDKTPSGTTHLVYAYDENDHKMREKAHMKFIGMGKWVKDE